MMAIAILFVVLMITFVAAFATGCGKSEHETLKEKLSEYIDEETGVHYFVYQGFNRFGITARYNSDGTVMVDKAVTE